MFPCESCGKTSSITLAPCPDGLVGCLVAHYNEKSYICQHCGQDNYGWISKNSGIHFEEIGIGVANIESIKKLELYSEEKK